jgi:hypothetical protein
MRISKAVVLMIMFIFACAISNAEAKTAAKAAEPAAKQVAPSSQVDLNSASQQELEKLPGVGPAAAKKIIAGRPYASTAELAKAGIPAKTISNITPLVKAGKAPAVEKATAAKTSPAPAVTPVKPAKASPPTASAKAAAPMATPPAGKDMVWVNSDSKVFHRPGSRWYGKTKQGSYMKESEAVKAGYRESKSKDK